MKESHNSAIPPAYSKPESTNNRHPEALSILESLSDAVIALDQDHCLTYINPAAGKFMNCSADACLGRKGEDVFLYVPNLKDLLTKALNDGTHQHFEIYLEEKRVWSEGNITKAGDGLVLHFRDITDRKATHERQRLNLERLEALARLNHMDKEKYEEIARYALQEALRLTGSEIGWMGSVKTSDQLIVFDPWVVKKVRDGSVNVTQSSIKVGPEGLMAKVAIQQRPIIINNYPESAGKSSPTEWHVPLKRILLVPILEDNKIVVLAAVANKGSDYDESDEHQLSLLTYGFWRIVTRKKAEEDLRESEERFYKIFNSSPMMMALIEAETGKYVDVNAQWETVTGYSKTEIEEPGLSLGFCLGEQQLAELMNEFQKNGEVRDVEVSLQTKFGEMREVIYSLVPVNLRYSQCWLMVGIDSTEKNKIERAMARIDTLNLVGEMAASIGHELRNPMTTVRGYLQLMKEHAVHMENIDMFDMLIEELDRADAIIKEFLYMAKDKTINLENNNLTKTVKAVLPLITANVLSMDMNIRIDLNDVANTLFDEKEIRQLLYNLCQNALEAMKPGGTLFISTYSEADHVVLEVKDQGPGIDPVVLDKIGTPFLTTKDQGTGLGLSVCYGIAHRHRAGIEVETGEQGTSFFVSFPIN